MEHNDMSSDEVVDYFTQEFATAYLKLENALDQADVTLDQIMRIKTTLEIANDKLKDLLHLLASKA